MFKFLRTILLIVWLIDILNINFTIENIQVAEFLDVTVPLNGWFWLLLWMLMPTSRIIVTDGK